MKRISVFLIILFSSLSLAVYAQSGKDIVTEKYKVEGNCDMCKKRIEEAAFVKGVKRTEWNKETGMLTVIYRPSKTSSTDILTAVAKAGHSTEKVAATAADYDKLPQCCHYKTESCDH